MTRYRKTADDDSLAEVRAMFAQRFAEGLMNARVPEGFGADHDDPAGMLDYLRHAAKTDPLLMHAVAFVEQVQAELADYKASTAETLELNRKISDRLRSDLARMSTRCRFFEDATKRMLDGTLTESEERFARQLLADANTPHSARSRQDQAEHPNVYVPGGDAA